MNLIHLFKRILTSIVDSHANVHMLETGFPLKDDVRLWADEIHPTDG